MKTLLILRHAKSSWADMSLDDYERPLNKRGKRDAPRIGRLLRTEDLLPDLVISSKARRARRTARAVADASGFEGELALTDEFYHASPEAYIEVLCELPAEFDCVMIVGHNPGLEYLLEMMTDEDERMPTAALAQVSLLIDTWAQLDVDTVGKLVRLWRPRELPEGL